MESCTLPAVAAVLYEALKILRHKYGLCRINCAKRRQCLLSFMVTKVSDADLKELGNDERRIMSLRIKLGHVDALLAGGPQSSVQAGFRRRGAEKV